MSSLQLQHDYVLSRKEQLKIYLSNNCRPDGREFDAVKPIVISPDVHSASSFGSSMVKWGNTMVSCSVTVQVGTPDPQAPAEGSIVFDAALWSICSSAYDSQRHRKPSDALLLESTLAKMYAGNSGAIDLSQLCIEAGKCAFCLCVQVVCLSSDGSLLEAAVLAVSAALARTVLPAVSRDDNLKIRFTSPSQSRALLAAQQQGEETAKESRDSSGVRVLVVKRFFAGLSMAVVRGAAESGESVLLLDPSLQEAETETVSDTEGGLVGSGSDSNSLSVSRVLTVVDLQGDLCLVQSSSSSALSGAQFLQTCESCAREAHRQVIPLLLPLLP